MTSPTVALRFASTDEWKELGLPMAEDWLYLFATDSGQSFPIAVFPVLDKWDNFNSYMNVFTPKGNLSLELIPAKQEDRNLLHKAVNEFVFNYFDTIIVDDKKRNNVYAVRKNKGFA